MQEIEIGIDKSNGEDGSALSLRFGEEAFTITSPFADYLIGKLERLNQLEVALKEKNNIIAPLHETYERNVSHYHKELLACAPDALRELSKTICELREENLDLIRKLNAPVDMEKVVEVVWDSTPTCFDMTYAEYKKLFPSHPEIKNYRKFVELVTKEIGRQREL